MCLLLLLHRVVDGIPIAVAAVRDEFYDRPSEPPALRESTGNGGRILAPRDLRHGGTWLGVNGAGVLAALTNRPGEREPALPSRGELPLRALGKDSATRAAEAIARRVESVRYGPFNLLITDGEDARVVHHGGRPRTVDLAPGVHVLTNFGDLDTVLFEEIRATYDPVDRLRDADPDTLVRALVEIASDRTTRSPEGHTIVKDYDERGTVSSTVVVIPATADPPRMLHAGDFPHPSRYDDASALLGKLLGVET